jgi:RHS repeat-associated protein
MIDLNANPSSILLDELGLVKALAIEGNGVFTDATRTAVNIIQPADSILGLKEYTEPNEVTNIALLFGSATSNSTNTNQLRQAGNNLLQEASVRFVYDFDTYQNTENQPVVVASIAREEHFSVNNNSKIQFSFEYSDGLGKVAMTKVQAEPGMAYYMEHGQKEQKDTGTDLRWVGTGRTVLNNKGNPVKQYEPYFSTNFLYEDAPELVEIGVTPILYYDSPGRLIKTSFPDGTLSRVEFDSWKQINFDQNDTVLESDWYHNRINNLIDAELTAQGKDPAKENQAAQKAAAHANTPSSLYLDSLGRPIFSVAHNGKDAASKDRLYSTFIALDIEGNAKAVVDARGNTVMAYKYDLLGHRVYQNSMDAGERWVLNNLMGNPVHRWDSRNHIFSFDYDAAQRPISINVKGGDGTALDHIYELTVYGEGQTNEYQHNLRGQVYQLYDTAGRVQNLRFDFKGNVLEMTRDLNANYKDVPNWIPANLNNAAVFDSDLHTYTSQIAYDALNRAINTITPDSSETKPVFNEAGLLEQVRVTQTGVAEKLFVKDIDYDAKGQRERIVYGDRNGNNLATTTYQYDEKTFRLIHLKTTKPNGGLLQDMYYTYDPVGNISEIEDKATPTKFFNNFKIEPKGIYKYDALYRLIEAEGKEHAGQAVNFGQCDNWKDQNFLKSYSPDDDLAWRKYTQKYVYDPVGNILEMNHDAPGGNWTRLYEYETANNRLKQTQAGGQTYTYPHHPQHGFIHSLPHLSVMAWNFKDELQASARQVVCNDNHPPETTYYVYDATGQRVRKVTENNGGGSKKEERLYLGGIEIYKKHSGNHRELERITLHVMDDTRRIAMVDTRNTVNDDTDQRTVRCQFGNHLGSASLELNDVGDVISYEEYHPFGTTAYQAVNKDIKVTAKRYRYTGMERDEESGLEYHSARYYLVWLGRWLSSDPIGAKDGVNLYSYVRGNPIAYNDHTGYNSNLNVSGTDENKKLFINQVNEVTGGKYEIVDGKLQAIGENYGRGPTAELFKKSIDSDNIINIDLTKDNDSVYFDSYLTTQVDIGDLEKSPDTAFKSALYSHFLAERLNAGDRYDTEAERIEDLSGERFGPYRFLPEFLKYHDEGLNAESRALEYHLGLSSNSLQIRQDNPYQPAIKIGDDTYNVPWVEGFEFNYGSVAYTVKTGIILNGQPGRVDSIENTKGSTAPYQPSLSWPINLFTINPAQITSPLKWPPIKISESIEILPSQDSKSFSNAIELLRISF